MKSSGKNPLKMKPQKISSCHPKERQSYTNSVKAQSPSIVAQKNKNVIPNSRLNSKIKTQKINEEIQKQSNSRILNFFESDLSAKSSKRDKLRFYYYFINHLAHKRDRI